MNDTNEPNYWKHKWEESTNIVSVMEALLHSQALQIAELKAKLRETTKKRHDIRKQHA